MARRRKMRRAMSFLELAVVVAIVGLLAVSAISTFGRSSLSNGSGEGFVRKISLALLHARRATISTGDNHYLQLSPSAANVTSYALYRRTSGGNVQVDVARTVPNDVTVSSSHAVLEFDFDGAALAGYSLNVTANDRSWNLSAVTLTGSVSVSETTP
jgi:type II secretory pathway pseudopilin PulG